MAKQRTAKDLAREREEAEAEIKGRKGRKSNGNGRKTSGLDAAIQVLNEADRPMKAREVASIVVERKLAPGLKGKTPEATITAQLYSAAKKGERVRKAKEGLELIPA